MSEVIMVILKALSAINPVLLLICLYFLYARVKRLEHRYNEIVDIQLQVRNKEKKEMMLKGVSDER